MLIAPPERLRTVKPELTDGDRQGCVGSGYTHCAMHWLTPLFVFAVLAGLALDLWLSQRQVRAVARHRGEVPAPFADSISADQHGKAADYTIAKLRFSRLGTVLDAAVLLVLTVGGGIALADSLWRRTGLTEPWLGVAVIATIALFAQLLSLPFAVWRTF